jgi:hypothetical protein
MCAQWIIALFLIKYLKFNVKKAFSKTQVFEFEETNRHRETFNKREAYGHADR